MTHAWSTASHEPATTFFTEHGWRSPRNLSDTQVRDLRQRLKRHANNPLTGSCAVCARPSCPSWRDAYDQLATAGELMAEPGRW